MAVALVAQCNFGHAVLSFCAGAGRAELDLHLHAHRMRQSRCDVFDRSNDSGQQRLRVFVLDEGLPYPLDSGKRIRTWNLLSRLASRHDLTLFCFDEHNPDARSFVERHGIRVLLGPMAPNSSGFPFYARLFANLFSPYPFSVSKHFSRRFHARFLAQVNDEAPDLIHVEWTPYARYLSGTSPVKTVIGTHNIEAQIWFRRASQSKTVVDKSFFGLQAFKMSAFEKRFLLRADAVTAVSPNDLQWLKEHGVRDASLVENGVDVDYFQPATTPEEQREILFLASLDWYPNQDALRYFATEILPRVRAKLPHVGFEVAGRQPPPELAALVKQIPATTLHANLADIRPLVARAAAFVVPLRIGGGSRIKILEALAAGKAVVSTTVGAEGLQLTSGRHLLLADEPSDFAEHIVDILTQPELRRRLGAGGRELVMNRYTWNQMADRLEQVWLRASSMAAGKTPVHLKV